MNQDKQNVLFLSTGNSARSIMCEALMNHLGSNRFRAFSAGSQPKGFLDPLALLTLERLLIPSEGLQSKGWEEFARSDAPTMDFVISVCDEATGETPPVLPEQPMSAAWGVPDPAKAPGGPEERAMAFMDAAVTLKRRIELMLALPMDRLDAMAIHREMADIGKLEGKAANIG